MLSSPSEAELTAPCFLPSVGFATCSTDLALFMKSHICIFLKWRLLEEAGAATLSGWCHRKGSPQAAPPLAAAGAASACRWASVS